MTDNEQRHVCEKCNLHWPIAYASPVNIHLCYFCGLTEIMGGKLYAGTTTLRDEGSAPLTINERYYQSMA